jgi:hypothetical protein
MIREVNQMYKWPRGDAWSMIYFLLINLKSLGLIMVRTPWIDMQLVGSNQNTSALANHRESKKRNIKNRDILKCGLFQRLGGRVALVALLKDGQGVFLPLKPGRSIHNFWKFLFFPSLTAHWLGSCRLLNGWYRCFYVFVMVFYVFVMMLFISFLKNKAHSIIKN